MSKRRFFQMHLSTAVVLMLVAGVLVWANVRILKSEVVVCDFAGRVQPYDLTVNHYGWPFESKVQGVVSHETSVLLNTSYYPKTEWLGARSFYNLLIALAILLTAWQVCEWRIRRAAAKHSPPTSQYTNTTRGA